MSIHIPQNFYRQTITRAVTLTGATNIYVSALPTPDEGYITISPASATLREIIYYTAKGTDGNGYYITVTLANRGLGGTTAQTHIIGEPVRMNVGAETIQEISDAIDQIVAGGAQDASTTVKGLSKLSVAPVSATSPIAVGDNDPRVPTADPTTIFSKICDVQTFTTTGANTWTKPAGAKSVSIVCIGGGGGGTNSPVSQCSGGGGGGGGVSRKILPASILGSTETVTVGVGGTAGVSGGNSSFGSWVVAIGGSTGTYDGVSFTVVGGAGGAGDAPGALSPANTSGSVGLLSVTGGASGATSLTGNNVGTSGGNSWSYGAGGGASGAHGTGDTGGTGGSVLGSRIKSGGAGGSGASGAGSNGASATTNEPTPGAGGGGGGSSSTTGANGGNGGLYGGGGGGAGSGSSSGGTGGTGGQGIVQVITLF